MSQNYGGRDVRRVIKAHDAIAWLYSDDRFQCQDKGHELRSFLATLLWVTIAERAQGELLQSRLTTLHPSNIPSDPWWTIRQIVKRDCPRYEPPNGKASWHGVECGAPMIRRDGVCGQRASEAFRVTDAVTGHWHMAGGCGRHRDWAQGLRRAEKERQAAGNLPEPIPNTGGLAPSHSNVNWPNLYRWADPYWTPPRVGIVAADWPTIAKVQAHQKPDFTVVAGEGIGAASGDRPVFELIRGGE